MGKNKKKFKIHLNLSQTIALAFVLIIVAGAILLSLPFATKNPEGITPLTALFTSTSAVCVTGLSLVDIWSTFTIFGQAVMLILIEIGGLGFMSAISMIFYLLNHKNGVHSLSLIAESLGADGIKHITRIQKRLLIGSFLFQGTGAIALFARFVSKMSPLKAAWLGLFHSVSSFCNAGFDLMGYAEPGSSLQTVKTDPVILLTLAILIIVGGLGFVVWDDIVSSKKIRNWSVNTKLVMCTTLGLLFIGAILYFIMEQNNPDTFGDMTLGEKIYNSFFQSASPRTAGFAAVDQNALTGSAKAFTIFLMIIGGSAGSTAGGIKTVTFVILVKAILSYSRGKRNVILMHRAIKQEQVAYAYTVATTAIMLGIVGGFVIDATSNLGFSASYFESVSALATVGLSLGVTAQLSTISKLLVIVFMYLGRVGLLTVTFGFIKSREDTSVKYPPAKIMIG